MSEKQEDQGKGEDEHSLDEIEKELDELRPPPPSPKTKRRIEEEEKKKDQELNEHDQHKGSAVPLDVKSDNEESKPSGQGNEVTPGKPDPTVNDNVKIPVLNDRGDVELKPQQGSALHKSKDADQTSTKEEGN